MKEITTKVGKKNKEGKDLPIYSINNQTGFLPQSEQFEGVDSNSRGYDTSLYKVIGKNTFAYNPARINVGSIGYSGELENILISSLYVCFRTKKQINDLFLRFFIGTSTFNQFVGRNVEGGIRNYLFYENFSRIPFAYPSPAEQQKIADCLSSIDELIQVETERLEALQAHKKGLMQQLFPAEGETVPKLRFPEFQDSGEWVEEELGDKEVSKFVSDKAVSIDLDIETYVSTENLIPNYGGKFKASKLPESGSFNRYNKGDILFSNIRPYLKKVWQACGEGVASNDIIIIRNSKNFNALFFSCLLKNDAFIEYIMKSAEGVKMPRGNKDSIKKYKVAFPKIKEQEKIAKFLHSLDEGILSQTEKIESLKCHKKGLLQQLFPQLD